MGGKESSLTLKQGDLIMGIMLLGFAVAFYYFSYHFSGYQFETVPYDVGPGFLPRLFLGALAIEAIALILTSVSRGTGSDRMKPIFQLRPVLMLGSFVVYIYLSILFGYILATIAFMILAFLLLGVRIGWTLILVPPLITFASYFLFGSLLNIYLPSGSLF